MLFTTAVLALATGFAAAKPVPSSESAVSKRQSFGGIGNGFDFVNGFNNFNNQEQIVQFQQETIQINNNGFQQQIIQQAQDILIVQNGNNGFRNNLDNVFRKSNFRNQFRDRTTVLLVVQEIQVAIDDGRGGLFQQNIFAQSAIVANRGAFATQTIQILSQETLIAQNVLGNDFRNFDRNAYLLGQQSQRDQRLQALRAGGQNIPQLPTKTNNVQLFGARPTWTANAADPAATLGGIWADEIQDLQSNKNDGSDNELNNQAAAEEQKGLGAQGQIEGGARNSTRKY